VTSSGGPPAAVPVLWEDALRELEELRGVRGFLVVESRNGSARHVRGDVGIGELAEVTEPLGVLARKLGARGEAEVAMGRGILRVTPVGRGLLLALVHDPEVHRPRLDMAIAALAVAGVGEAGLERGAVPARSTLRTSDASENDPTSPAGDDGDPPRPPPSSPP